MFASSQPGLHYTQSFLKHCFSNIKSCSKGKGITWEGGVAGAVQVGGAFFVLFGVLSFLLLWFCFGLFYYWGGVLVFLSRVSCSGNLTFLIGRTATKYKPHMLLQDSPEEQ